MSSGRIPPRSSLRYTDKFSKHKLDSMRVMGDPLADAVAAELHATGGLVGIHDLLSSVRTRAELPEGRVFREFLEQTARVPEWRDRKAVERGQRLHAVTYPFQGISLFSGSLVGGAQFSNAAIVTALAGNITTDPTRRITETGMLLAALALPGMLEVGGRAHDSLLRVRLLHAALRNWLPRTGRLVKHKEAAPAHVYVDGEVPINQQDLAITLGVFLYINVRSLKRMGIHWSRDDCDAYVQMWRYAGHILGIVDDLLPRTIADMEEFMHASMLHQGAPEAIEGPKIRAFVDEFAAKANKDSRGIVPFTAAQSFLYQTIVYLNGKEYTSGMGIEDLGPSHWAVRLVHATGFVFGTLVPRYIPLGEEVMFRAHTFGIRRALARRGTPTGHGAGTGKEPPIEEVQPQSRL